MVAKLAVDRLKRFKRTGTAIGQVYAWGMVGSILGTFLTGFFLIDMLGTKGVILVLGTIMAFGATMLGSLVHAVWAGIPLGLCVLAFTPPAWIDAVGKVVPRFKGRFVREDRQEIGASARSWETPDRSAASSPGSMRAITTTSRSTTSPRMTARRQKRTLVLDNLIHGYFILGHPERLDYDYEHIYALVAYRAAKASGKVKFKPAPEPPRTRRRRLPRSRRSPPRQDRRPGPAGKACRRAQERCQVEAPTNAKGQRRPPITKTSKRCRAEKDQPVPPGGQRDPRPNQEEGPIRVQGQASLATRRRTADSSWRRTAARRIPAVEKSDLKTLFLGGGAYCFQRHMQFAYPGTAVDVAEIDPVGDPGQLHGHRTAASTPPSRPTGATPASSSSCTRTPRSTTWSSATPSTTSRCPGTSRRASSTKRSRRCSRPTAST